MRRAPVSRQGRVTMRLAKILQQLIPHTCKWLPQFLGLMPCKALLSPAPQGITPRLGTHTAAHTQQLCRPLFCAPNLKATRWCHALMPYLRLSATVRQNGARCLPVASLVHILCCVCRASPLHSIPATSPCTSCTHNHAPTITCTHLLLLHKPRPQPPQRRLLAPAVLRDAPRQQQRSKGSGATKPGGSSTHTSISTGTCSLQDAVPDTQPASSHRFVRYQAALQRAHQAPGNTPARPTATISSCPHSPPDTSLSTFPRSQPQFMLPLTSLAIEHTQTLPRSRPTSWSQLDTTALLSPSPPPARARDAQPHPRSGRSVVAASLADVVDMVGVQRCLGHARRAQPMCFSPWFSPWFSPQRPPASKA